MFNKSNYFTFHNDSIIIEVHIYKLLRALGEGCN